MSLHDAFTLFALHFALGTLQLSAKNESFYATDYCTEPSWPRDVPATAATADALRAELQLMNEIVAVDVGGTNARFAIAEADRGRVVSLSRELVLKTSDHPNFESAWQTFSRSVGVRLPTLAAVAVAGPVQGELLKLTNNAWVISPDALRKQLKLDRLKIVNDLGAVGYAVAQLGHRDLTHVCGPAVPLPEEGVISIVGLGTGLGVAQLFRHNGTCHVIETEGGHVDFAPVDQIDESILEVIRERYGRVSAERLISGPGLVNVYEALARMEGSAPACAGDAELWSAAIARSDRLAGAALDRLCLSLGSFCGDIALAQGAKGVVIAGGLGLRLAKHLPDSGFAQRFVAKGRFQRHLASLPVKALDHPQAGLLGAAAALLQESGGRQLT